MKNLFLCKKTLYWSNIGGVEFFVEGKFYECVCIDQDDPKNKIITMRNSSGQCCFFRYKKDDSFDGRIKFEDYFYTVAEARKLKLQNINEISV